MRSLMMSSLLVLASACGGGSLKFADKTPCDAGSCFYDLELLPGSSGQVTLLLEAEGSMAGDYQVSAKPASAAVSAAFNQTAFTVKSGTPAEVRVTLSVANTATPKDDGYVAIEAWPVPKKTDRDYALRGLKVKIVQ